MLNRNAPIATPPPPMTDEELKAALPKLKYEGAELYDFSSYDGNRIASAVVLYQCDGSGVEVSYWNYGASIMHEWYETSSIHVTDGLARKLVTMIEGYEE